MTEGVVAGGSAAGRDEATALDASPRQRQQRARFTQLFGDVAQRQPPGPDAQHAAGLGVPEARAPAFSEPSSAQDEGGDGAEAALSNVLAAGDSGQAIADVAGSAAESLGDQSSYAAKGLQPPDAVDAHGIALGGLGLASGLVGAGLAAHRGVKAHAGYRRLDQARKSRGIGHKLRRERIVAAADSGERTAASASSALAMAKAIAHAGSQGFKVLGSVGGGVMAALGLVQFIRLVRKAAHARRRGQQLGALLLTRPPPTLAGVQEQLDARYQVTAERLAAVRRLGLDDIAGQVQLELDAIGRAITQAEPAHAQMLAAVRERAAKPPGGPPSLVEIQAYALRKKRRGVLKRAVDACAAAVSFGGGTAMLVASIAAAGSLATPVGWGLAVLAAVIGTGMLLYRAGRSAHKRYKLTGGRGLGTLGRLGLSLKFWRKLGASKRENHAARLIELAGGTDASEREPARTTLLALGLREADLPPQPPATLPEDERDALRDLVADKMAS